MRTLTALVILGLCGCHGLPHHCGSCHSDPVCATEGTACGTDYCGSGCGPACGTGSECESGHWYDSWIHPHSGHASHGGHSHKCYSRCVDDHKVKHHAKKLAHHYLEESPCNTSCDFATGYKQAFIDVWLGADGQVPAAAPSRYWKAKYRTPEGRAQAEEWFAGYAAGASQALAIRGESHRVASTGVGYPSYQPYVAPAPTTY